MDYKKRYEELYERISNLVRDYDCVSGLIDVREELKSILNESQESEDEGIMKNLREFLLDAPSQDLVSHHIDLEKTFNWLERQGEQKPVEWHREDEQNLNACLGYIPDEFLRRWLKDTIHIKYDKHAWSEEDERHLSIAIQYVFQHGYLSTVNWLKSLKERYSWKPNKEQMETIPEILTVDCPPNFRKRVESLYTDLKKL